MNIEYSLGTRTLEVVSSTRRVERSCTQMNSKAGGFLSSRRLEQYDARSECQCPGVLSISFPTGCR